MGDISQRKENNCNVQCTIVKEIQDQHRDFFNEAQSLIYYELPVLISKIFHAEFANCECVSPVIDKEDMKFIEGFIGKTESVFKIAMEGQRKQIEEMLKMDEQ